MGEKKPGNQIKKNGHEISSKPGIDDEFVSGIRELILAARAVSKRSIDKIQVITCFEIGARIVEREQKGKARAQYGKQNTKFSNFNLAEQFCQIRVSIPIELVTLCVFVWYQ